MAETISPPIVLTVWNIKVLSGEGDVYIGPNIVTTTSGYLMKANDELWLDVGPDDKLYALVNKRVTGDPVDVRVLEIG